MGTNVNEVWIGADRSTVFAALTTRDGLDRWWGKVVEATPEVGSVIEFDHGLGVPLLMEVTELEPDARVAWRCTSLIDDPVNPASEWVGQTFVFELRPRQEVPLIDSVQDVTIVRMINDGWPDDTRWQAFCNTAWGVTLETKLKPWCEDGESHSGMVGES